METEKVALQCPRLLGDLKSMSCDTVVSGAVRAASTSANTHSLSPGFLVYTTECGGSDGVKKTQGEGVQENFPLHLLKLVSVISNHS